MSAGLSVLPPSPPTTTSRKRASLTQDLDHSRAIGSIKGIHVLKDPSLGTPDELSASFTGSGSGSSKSRKRVEFSPWTNIHTAPVFTISSPENVSVRPLLPSRELSSSASILKTSGHLDPTPQTVEDESQPEVSLVEMLDSITQQLSQNEVAKSLDAYQTLSSTLKAYSEVPDAHAFKSKLGPLMQYIRRDLATLDKSEYGPAEINLATQTLKVLAILAWNRNFSILLNNEIQGYILDRAIHVVEEHKAPKGVMLHYLHLLSTQDFRHSIVASSGRVGRLLDALKDLTKHVKGNGTISERLMVYQRLLEQARSQMKSKALSWMQELIDGLTGLHRETSTRAIELGTKAAAVFPASSTVARALRTVLDMRLEDGKTIGTVACKRLEKMLVNKDDSLNVPQIWAIVISLMKGIEGGIDKWGSLKDWLKVVQRCFNSSNSAIRSQANIAWNRFVYVVSPSEVNESLLGMLIKPVVVQMERKGMEREDRSSRATAFSAYCNLLYYAFRPSASHKQYDRVWDEYVVKVMTTSFLEKSPAAADRACRIFMALFWNDGSKSKLWREIRAQENVLMEPEELPTIDCKWIRSKATSILKIFKLLFQNSSWGSEDRPDQSFVATAWKNFSKALGAACCKEMKPSVETKQALTNTLAFLSDVWKTGPCALNALEDSIKDAFMIRFGFVCMSVLTETGAIPLVEGSLPANFVGEHMQTVAPRESVPIIQFLGVLSSVSDSVMPNKAYYDFVREILLLPRKGRIPTRLRIRLLCQSALSVLVTNSQTLTETAGQYIWQAIASAVQKEFDPPDALVSLKPEIDNVLEDVIKILEIGVAYSPSSTTPWCSLLDSLVDFATQGELQDVTKISTIAHSLTSCIEKAESPRLTMEIAELINCVVPSIELSVARVSPRQSRGKLRTKMMVVMSPLFNKLLVLLDFYLEQAYAARSAESLPGISGIIDATCRCLSSCPSEVLVHCLEVLETSLCLWLQDKQRLLTTSAPVGAVKLTAGRKMCSLLISIFAKLCERGSGLEQLGSLLTAGFQSTHKLTVNQMIEMWNATFGTKGQRAYPQPLRAALERLQPFVDLGLPNFGTHVVNLETADAPTFSGSQEEDAQGRLGLTEFRNGDPMSTENHSNLSLSPWKGRAFGSPSLAPQVAQAGKDVTPMGNSTIPKPRHDDSQVQYVAIESSPLQEIDNESQYLTDRQKEVRTRRQAESVVVFPDLRSSPLPQNSLLGLVRSKDISLDLNEAESPEGNGPATPTLPMLPNEAVDEKMASSPTPQSKQPVLRLDDIELPSSPPSMPGVAGLEPVDRTQNGLLPGECHQTGEGHQHQASGATFLLKKQPPELAEFEIKRKTDSRDLADVGPEDHVPKRGSLDGGGKMTDQTLQLESLVATGSPHVIVVDTTTESRNGINTVNVEENIFMESIAVSRNEPMKKRAIPSLKDLQPENTHENSVLVEKNASTRYETNNEPQNSKEMLRQDVELAGMFSTRPSVAMTLQPGKLTEEHLTSQGNICTPRGERTHPAILSNFGAVTRVSPATSNDSRAESDEVDKLSASQLSQDLDWHVALEKRVSQTDKSPQTEVNPTTLKRKRSVGYFASPKRRKSIGSPTERGRPIDTQPSRAPGQSKRSEEVLDCIVLDMAPQPAQAANRLSRLSSDAVNTQKGGKKRGRKPKQRSNTLPSQYDSSADWASSSQPNVVVKVEAMDLKEERSSVEGSPILFSRLEEASSPRTAATTIREAEGYSTLARGVTMKSPTPLETHAMAKNGPVAVLIQSAAITPGEVLDDHVESCDVPNIPQSNEATHPVTPLGVQIARLAMGVMEGTALAPAQHARLSFETKNLPHGPEMPANTVLEVGMFNASGRPVAVAAEASVQMDMIGALQEVLNNLKSASMERPALREIEDLLFEIRTEAQHAVGRQVDGQ